MSEMTRTELDEAERNDFALGPGPLRPRDAATLILLDRKDAEVRVLMGRRSSRHAFMPGKFVFPGGRTDPADSRIRTVTGLHPDEETRLRAGPGRTSPARARAIALSAIRETYEEAGLLIGRKGEFSTPRADWQGFADHHVQPSLEAVRFVARAITPPGRVRRYDTRFLGAWRGEVAVELPAGGPTTELEELVWLPLGQARQANIPAITGMILEELEKRLATDSDLRPGMAVPFFHMVGNRFVRDLL